MESQSHTYIAMDLKSFYASVECVDRGLDPLNTNLVVADASRTQKTICLAVSPSLKSYGIPGRARLFEVISKVREVNAMRKVRSPGGRFLGKSTFADELQRHPELEVGFVTATPRMARYLEYSTQIYNIYLKYIAPEDIHVYSIDEVFLDVTQYLKTYGMMDKEQGRNQRIIDTAFRLFVEKKIEAVSMDEVAKEAGVGRATLFRCYNNKTELAIAVCASKWKAYLDKLDEVRPISSIHDIPAIGRFIFTLDSYIGMYQNHKDLLQYNDNFNNYITHQTVRQEELANFHASLNSVNTRLHMMYAKAKEDKTFRTDIPEEQFMRVTVHTMMAACTHYAGGFIWGATDNKDYTGDLLLLKEMILNYARNDANL